ncbi:MAG: hypothetical protein MUF58_23975 [Arcicella sp.]|jgi:hypothetical protein|nr:hypothetical protein [Arcicella sp.]
MSNVTAPVQFIDFEESKIVKWEFFPKEHQIFRKIPKNGYKIKEDSNGSIKLVPKLLKINLKKVKVLTKELAEIMLGKKDFRTEYHFSNFDGIAIAKYNSSKNTFVISCYKEGVNEKIFSHDSNGSGGENLTPCKI